MNDFSKDKLPQMINIYPKLSDFFVDFFGALIPGIIFTAILSIIVINYCLDIIIVFNLYYFKGQRLIPDNMLNVPHLSNYIHLILLILFIVASYTFGFIFLRFGPKQPDQTSFKRFLKKRRNEEKIDYLLKTYSNIKIDGQTSKEDKLLAINEASKNILWPYDHLHELLMNRSVPNLAKMIDWGKGKEQKANRTKINAIKETIQFHFPDHYGIIARHEGQVRFLSSIWHVCRILIYLSIIGFLVSLILFLLNSIIIKYVIFPQLLIEMSIAFLLVVIIISYYIKISIEDNFHFRRVREITSILNIAYQARKIDPNFGREFWPDNM